MLKKIVLLKLDSSMEPRLTSIGLLQHQDVQIIFILIFKNKREVSYGREISYEKNLVSYVKYIIFPIRFYSKK